MLSDVKALKKVEGQTNQAERVGAVEADLTIML